MHVLTENVSGLMENVSKDVKLAVNLIILLAPPILLPLKILLPAISSTMLKIMKKQLKMIQSLTMVMLNPKLHPLMMRKIIKLIKALLLRKVITLVKMLMIRTVKTLMKKLMIRTLMIKTLKTKVILKVIRNRNLLSNKQSSKQAKKLANKLLSL